MIFYKSITKNRFEELVFYLNAIEIMDSGNMQLNVF